MALPPVSPSGVSTAYLYPTQVGQGQGWTAIAATNPPNTNPPIIFEPYPELSGNEYAVWMIASGGASWGGCGVFISIDGPNGPFQPIGVVFPGGTQGVTTADFPIGSDPDTTDTLSLDVSESGAQITPATQNDADNFVTLCYLGAGQSAGYELIAYSAATLTGSFTYDLDTYIRRGCYGTTIADAPTGTQFGRIQPSTFRQRYPANLIGQTIWVKLPSVNNLGLNLQELSAIPAYAYTLTGVGVSPVGTTICPPDIVLAAGGSMDWGALGAPVASQCDWGVLGTPVMLQQDMGVLGA